jgi:hypothetical protein
MKACYHLPLLLLFFFFSDRPARAVAYSQTSGQDLFFWDCLPWFFLIILSKHMPRKGLITLAQRLGILICILQAISAG